LTGFSHGAAGIGWALVKLGLTTVDERFVDGGLAGFAYERGEYRPDPHNWPDHRVAAGDPAGRLCAWCHGAAGIGLARADLLADVDDPGLRADVDLAVTITLERGF